MYNVCLFPEISVKKWNVHLITRWFFTFEQLLSLLDIDNELIAIVPDAYSRSYLFLFFSSLPNIKEYQTLNSDSFLFVQDGCSVTMSDLSSYFMGLGLVSDQHGSGESSSSQQHTQPATAGGVMPAPPPPHQGHHSHNYQSQPPAAAAYWQPQQQSSPIQVTGSSLYH